MLSLAAGGCSGYRPVGVAVEGLLEGKYGFGARCPPEVRAAEDAEGAEPVRLEWAEPARRRPQEKA